jgi:hypothetical protein
LKRRGIWRRWRMRPVPVVFLRMDLAAQLSKSQKRSPSKSDHTCTTTSPARTGPYSCAAWRSGNRRRRKPCAERGTSRDRSGGTACASSQCADQTRWYPWSIYAKRTLDKTRSGDHTDISTSSTTKREMHHTCAENPQQPRPNKIAASMNAVEN